ncbi:MAG: hypothetical protein A2725_01880 [Candidatus Magasanikbacteria bacterium RIFCSPHIGHO2_01_FULL_33_34]|uniref:Uncharacterized protein n=1 Tax=Candidatus Magasanikbacteria bacterium RIFCSPHIGHO2_01_FULL_33_34 TaxID=1798671 RepID=A0A1F6LKW8_9BACT|nr:MAG: hypothetical protein A2725_01880 [Candidatus Magasanikbacteria bacterium RIFCSPHIGHO2_01_FULL_33_34]OGH65720.1 MAG: hypothetical protein A3B83_02385 [Candidatus Magasanikbacteria bacterium RIFCSPHIGHO2_02_FULL_33_17]OGH76333.1 MAG: hypothetical protein A3A89_03210 [Candidatus Magasanikbacteria bacterium RIFCSPLOWO2_01_FULL_33_34]OGH82478.1 MAG: hypothetical protein A3F93_03755 [Candidatus Magasanikbacteria bacterium RIFCSPLOWO2_12_FULL_34_7]
MPCKYCHLDIGHLDTCPTKSETKAPAYFDGKLDARRDLEPQKPDDPRYMKGYLDAKKEIEKEDEYD